MNFNPSAVISVDSEVGEEEYGEAEDHRAKLRVYPALLKIQLCWKAWLKLISLGDTVAACYQVQHV